MTPRAHLTSCVAAAIGTFLALMLPIEGGTTEVESEGTAYYGDQQFSNARHKRESEAGFRLFVKNWRVDEGMARNANSCLTCHNTPMPGGSGIYEATFVDIDTSYPGTTREAVVQANLSMRSNKTIALVQRRTPPLFGIGTLENAIFARAHEKGGINEFDALFGSYGVVETLTDSVSLAFANELGVSTPIHCARTTSDLTYPRTCKADISEREVQEVVSYLRSLSPPPRKSGITAFIAGKRAFERLACSSCHKESLVQTERDQLLSKRIDAYTDLKRHNLGGPLPLRTAPLWGIDASGPPYLHDRSAESIEAAILRHGGEASHAAAEFNSLSVPEKAELIRFLRSL